MRTAIALSLACLALCGCGDPPPLSSAPPEAAPPSARPAPSEPPPGIDPLALVEPSALAGHVWTYFETVTPSMGCGFGGGGVAATCDPHYVGDSRTYAVVEHDGLPHLVRRDGERTVFDAPIGAAAGAELFVTDLEALPYRVWVAGVREGEVVLVLLDGDDGRVVGSTALPAIDADHAASGVQLALEAGRVVVFVRAARPWLALLTQPGLLLLDRADAGVALDDFRRERSWVRATSSASLPLESGTVHARGRRITGPDWTVTVEDPFRCRASALARWGDEILVLHHCPATSGAGLSFLASSDGATIAELFPGTIGTIGHSMYHADVDLAVEDERAYLHGVEAAGRYVAVVDLPQHRVLGVLIWR